MRKETVTKLMMKTDDNENKNDDGKDDEGEVSLTPPLSNGCNRCENDFRSGDDVSLQGSFASRFEDI
ncbi:hypothetical protein Bca4012_042035 [Brassica carinata]|uniref:Uncharacterized protein n=1 Tax=Brassica cretica TaxID=69181 RepID=A0A8S9NGR2_BRACR|nr:hypothetical protein F2Q69_00040738 [Brassica cretica]